MTTAREDRCDVVSCDWIIILTASTSEFAELWEWCEAARCCTADLEQLAGACTTVQNRTSQDLLSCRTPIELQAESLCVEVDIWVLGSFPEDSTNRNSFCVWPQNLGHSWLNTDSLRTSGRA
jgi:hypothetical protein